MKLPKLCLNSPMQIKAVIDFSWVGYLPPTDNLPVLTWTPAINLLGSKNKKQKYETPPIWGRKLPILSFTRLTYKIGFVYKSHSTLLSALLICEADALSSMLWKLNLRLQMWPFQCHVAGQSVLLQHSQVHEVSIFAFSENQKRRQAILCTDWALRLSLE